MPIGKPNGKENQYQFMNRCMTSVVGNRDFPNEKQRCAVCAKMWADYITTKEK